ncbi:MAG: hypothetical protein ACRDIU_05140 [Actinomycetota bacterium]
MNLAHGGLGSGPLTAPEIAIASAGGLMALIGAFLVLRTPQKGKSSGGKAGFALLGVGLVVAMLGPNLVPAPSGACARPTTQASVEIISPRPGEVLEGSKFDVEIRLSDGQLAGLSSTRNVKGQGHLHLSLDGKLVSMTGEAKQSIDAQPGEHRLTAEYVANDHAPFCKRVTDRVRFTVR